MKMNDYQKKARNTAIYPSDMKMIYPALGLAGGVQDVHPASSPGQRRPLTWVTLPLEP